MLGPHGTGCNAAHTHRNYPACPPEPLGSESNFPGEAWQQRLIAVGRTVTQRATSCHILYVPCCQQSRCQDCTAPTESWAREGMNTGRWRSFSTVQHSPAPDAAQQSGMRHSRIGSTGITPLPPSTVQQNSLSGPPAQITAPTTHSRKMENSCKLNSDNKNFMGKYLLIELQSLKSRKWKIKSLQWPKSIWKHQTNERERERDGVFVLNQVNNLSPDGT